MSSDRIEKQIELQASTSRVWRALTDWREFGEWFRVNLEGPFVVGQTTKGKITYPGYEHLLMTVGVQTIEAERHFAFHWHPYAIDPAVDYSQETPTLVEFYLQPIADGTLLKVIESGFDKIPAARRDEAFRMNENGWASQLKNIKRHVEQNAA